LAPQGFGLNANIFRKHDLRKNAGMITIVESILELKPSYISDVRTQLNPNFKSLCVYTSGQDAHKQYQDNFFHVINFVDEIISKHESNPMQWQIQSKVYKYILKCQTCAQIEYMCSSVGHAAVKIVGEKITCRNGESFSIPGNIG